MTYTKESLKELISSKLKDYKLIIVSNREPYIHNYAGEEIKYIIPASGMVTALDPIIRAEGGTWIAYGSGDADKEVVDSKREERGVKSFKMTSFFNDKDLTPCFCSAISAFSAVG